MFKQGVVDAEGVFHMVQLRSRLWMNHRVRAFSFSFLKWHLNPVFYIKSYM